LESKVENDEVESLGLHSFGGKEEAKQFEEDSDYEE
jgi:hypothetical protein